MDSHSESTSSKRGRDPTQDDRECVLFQHWTEEDMRRFTIDEENGDVRDSHIETERFEGSPISSLILELSESVVVQTS